jgi:predicted O-methyltransferase YrrM
MNFTQDWFSSNINNFQTCMSALDKRDLFMEIGSFEGRATCWMLEHGLADDGEITCIDSYIKLDFDPAIDMESVKDRFIANTKEATHGTQFVDLHEATSYTALSWLIQDIVGRADIYDFIYIDGSHAPDVALTDACMAWKLLRKGGVMLFDDYEYPHEPTKIGIDGFLNAFAGQYKTIVKNYQMGIQKL